ncbi:MAG: HAMP domain-containing histidine kinase [Clostridiales bacterium]|nr:HAMP domain-containing histidine kinase [Clostridiales bacterium]
MKKYSFLNCLKLYIKDHIKAFAFFLIAASIFALIPYLYHAPMEAFLYSLILSLCFGAVLFFVDFRKFCSIHSQLEAYTDTICLTLRDLPAAVNTLGRDYEQLIDSLYSQLIKTVGEAESSRNYMSDYYALWIHQIKVPISAMYLLLGESEKSSPLGIELFKIEQYVEMALSYVRMGSSSTDYVFKKYDLDNIVKHAVRKYAPLFIGKKISVDIKPTGYEILTDKKWLSFVIEQILSNSLKYTKTGTISIYGRKGTNLIIEDTGIGIASEDIKRVGEKGFTGYNGRSDKKSTGLGLYMSREVLKALSHSMDIESEVGEGTRVIIHMEHRSILEE